MAYSLEAVLGATEILETLARRECTATVVPLRHGMALIPLTDDLYDAVTTAPGASALGFAKLTPRPRQQQRATAGRAGGDHPNFVHCPSETTSTEPSTTLMAVCSSMA